MTTTYAQKDTQTYPLSILRAVALQTQKLNSPHYQNMPTPDTICDIIVHIGAVQLDTLQMVHRSHYLAKWSRVGTYHPPDFDRLVYGHRVELKIIRDAYLNIGFMQPVSFHSPTIAISSLKLKSNGSIQVGCRDGYLKQALPK